MNHFTKSKLYYKAMQTKYGILFLWTLIGFAATFIIYLFYSHYSLKQSQEQIRTDYIAHIQKADSLYIHWTEYNNIVMLSSQKVNNTVFRDSIIKSTLSNKYRLSRNQYDNLILVLNSHFAKIDSLHRQYDEKLLRDSLRLNTERGLLEGQTKTMLELHLNKIEHEYSNITMWGAVLTILFLVFSFYSIYKMDELIQQGNEGVKDIKRLKKEGNNSITCVKTENNEQIKKLKEETEKIIKEHREKLEGMSSNFSAQQNDLYKRANEYLNGLRKNSDEQSQKILAEYNIILQEQSNVYTKKINEQTEGFESRLTSIGEFITTLQHAKEKLDTYLSNVQKQMNSIEEQNKLFTIIIATLLNAENSSDGTTEENSNLTKLIERLQEAVKKNQIKNDTENGGQQDGQ